MRARPSRPHLVRELTQARQPFRPLVFVEG